MIKSLSVADVKHIAFILARTHMSYDEPIPDFNTRYPNILESCLVVPFQTFTKKPVYKGLIEKAAILFYLMIKNHPFQNGNKRIVITTLFVFLCENEKWLKIDTKELYNFAVWVAESNPKLKTETVESVKKILKIHLINLMIFRKGTLKEIKKNDDFVVRFVSSSRDEIYVFIYATYEYITKVLFLNSEDKKEINRFFEKELEEWKNKISIDKILKKKCHYLIYGDISDVQAKKYIEKEYPHQKLKNN